MKNTLTYVSQHHTYHQWYSPPKKLKTSKINPDKVIFHFISPFNHFTVHNFTTHHFIIHHFNIVPLHRFTGFPSNPCFLRQNPWFLRRYTVLLGILLAVPRMVRGGEAGGEFYCVARRCLRPRTWCYPGVRFNLL